MPKTLERKPAKTKQSSPVTSKGTNHDPFTQYMEEIGKEIGLSRERVRQIEKRAKLKLKSKLQSESWVDETK